MTDLTKLKELAERHVRQIAGFGPDGIIYTNDFRVDAKKVLELIAEVERLRIQVGPLALGAEQAMEERDRLKAENEALRKDAERYRWLKENCDIDYRGNTPHELYESTDPAIDAALEGGGK